MVRLCDGDFSVDNIKRVVEEGDNKKKELGIVLNGNNRQ